MRRSPHTGPGSQPLGQRGGCAVNTWRGRAKSMDPLPSQQDSRHLLLSQAALTSNPPLLTAFSPSCSTSIHLQ